MNAFSVGDRVVIDLRGHVAHGFPAVVVSAYCGVVDLKIERKYPPFSGSFYFSQVKRAQP